MKCSNCGSDNKEGYKFCSKCGSKLDLVPPESLTESNDKEEAFKAEMLRIRESLNNIRRTPSSVLESVDNMENEKTVILNDDDPITEFENDETVVMDNNAYSADFENEETMILDDSASAINDFENDETVVLDDKSMHRDFENEETMVLDDIRTPPAAPGFDYRTVYREYRTDYQDTSYINHLRRLKELLDDGIITEDEFTRKKQQIMGLE